MTSTTPLRRLAVGATTALLAAGLLAPAAIASAADEPPAEGQTTTVLDETTESPAVSEAVEPDAPAEEPAEAPAETPAETPAEAPDAGVDDGAADPATSPSAEEDQPAQLDAQPDAAAASAAGPASLVSTTALEPGETWTTTVAVVDAVHFSFYALGADVEGSMQLPSGRTVALYSLADFSRSLIDVTPAETGSVTLTLRNDGDTARTIPYAFAYQRSDVVLRASASAGKPELAVGASPSVNGGPRTDLTGTAFVTGVDGIRRAMALEPQRPGSSSYGAVITGLDVGRYLIEVVMPIDGVNHSMVITSTVAELETTPPTVEYLTTPAASNANGWFRRPVSVLLAASDAGSGVWRIHRGLDTTELEPFYGRNVSIAVDTEGEHVLRYYAEDNQQNASTLRERTIRIDLTSPEVTIDGVVDGETVEPETVMTIEYDCSDVLSGISECHGSVPSGSQLDTSTPGTYPVTVVGVDRAGNERRIELHYTVLGDDTVAPTLEVDAPEEPASGWFTTPVTLRFSAADTGSGVAGIFWEYSDGADVVTGSSADDEAQLTLDGTAEYAVEVWAEDADGNRSEPQHLTLRLDADAPVIQLHSPVPPEVAILPNGHYAQHERVVVDFECTDLGSGIERCDATTSNGELLPTGTPGTHELRIVATDVAGHRTEALLRYTVDATEPAAAPAARDPRLAQTGAEFVLPGIALVAVLLAAGATLLTARRLGGR